MPTISFTPALSRHVPCRSRALPGETVRELLERAFAEEPRLRSYILDDAGALRRHLHIFVDGEMIADRRGLGDRLRESSEVIVMQALSGG